MNTPKINLALGGALLALALMPQVRAQDVGTILCKDGSTAAQAGRDACSGHGGIDRAATNAAKSAAMSSSPMAGAQSSSSSEHLAAAPDGGVLCKDGTTAAHGGRGACSGHGGVDRTSHMQSNESRSAGVSERSTPNTAATGGPATEENSMNSSSRATHMAAAPTAQAAPGGGPDKVWVNTDSKVYYCMGDRWYGKTQQGQYMSETDARAQGFRADHNKACE